MSVNQKLDHIDPLDERSYRRAFNLLFVTWLFFFLLYQMLSLTDFAPRLLRSLPLYFCMTDMFTGYYTDTWTFEAYGKMASGEEVALGLDQWFLAPSKGWAPRYVFPRFVDTPRYHGQLTDFVLQKYLSQHPEVKFEEVLFKRTDRTHDAFSGQLSAPLDYVLFRRAIPHAL